MLVQNYGWPTGPTKIWLWLARRPFGWPRATGPAGSTTPVLVDNPFSVYMDDLSNMLIRSGVGCYIDKIMCQSCVLCRRLMFNGTLCNSPPRIIKHLSQLQYHCRFKL